MLRKIVYPMIEGPLNSAAAFLHSNGFTPNQLTVAGTALNFIAGYFYAGGHFTAGALMLLVAGMGDLLDGALARHSGKVTPFGAFLDSFCDRYSDFFLFGGLALSFAREGRDGLLLLTLFSLAGAYAVSYAKARAENFIKHCGVGFFERAVRLIVLFWGTFLPFLIVPALWILAIGANATAVHRLIHTRKTLLAHAKETS